MKTTILTIALAFATMTFAKSQTPAPAANGATQPAVTAPAKTATAKTTTKTKKHHKKAVKSIVKTPATPAVAK